MVFNNLVRKCFKKYERYQLIHKIDRITINYTIFCNATLNVAKNIFTMTFIAILTSLIFAYFVIFATFLFCSLAIFNS